MAFGDDAEWLTGHKGLSCICGRVSAGFRHGVKRFLTMANVVYRPRLFGIPSSEQVVKVAGNWSVHPLVGED